MSRSREDDGRGADFFEHLSVDFGGSLGKNGRHTGFLKDHAAQKAWFQVPDGNDGCVKVPQAQTLDHRFINGLTDNNMGQLIGHFLDYFFVMINAQDLMPIPTRVSATDAPKRPGPRQQTVSFCS